MDDEAASVELQETKRKPPVSTNKTTQVEPGGNVILCEEGAC